MDRKLQLIFTWLHSAGEKSTNQGTSKIIDYYLRSQNIPSLDVFLDSNSLDALGV